MSFFLYPGNKLETLSGICCRLIDDDPGSDPLGVETVVVQTQGMAAYLRQFMAQRSGIAANIRMPFPAGFINDILKENIAGFENASKYFSQEQMCWEIFAIFRDEAGEFPELAGYIGGTESSELKCFQLACRTAALFDRYQIYRYKEEHFPLKGSGWQSRLWYKLLKKFGKSKMQCCREFLALDRPLKGLPERLTVFGVGSLPPLYLDIFFKIAGQINLRFFYMTPCREFWEHLYSVKEQRWLCKGDEMPQSGNPLLAAWGASGRELFANLLDHQNIVPYVSSEELLFEDYCFQDKPATVLQKIQQDIFDMCDGRQNAEKTEPDDSIEILNCHAPRREVEVLHDKLLTLFAREKLELRDVIVMAPDINKYLPYIEAVFGRGPLKHCYSISDRSLQSGSGIGNTLCQLLKLPVIRLEVDEVMSILRHPAVYGAFKIKPEDLTIITDWLSESGIRWGFDGADHARHCSVPFEEFSWLNSLDNMFDIFARGSGEMENIVGHPPLLEESELELFGKLNRFIRALETFREQLGIKRTLQEWMTFLSETLDHFFLSHDRDGIAEITALRGFFADKKTIGYELGLKTTFSLDVILDMLAGFLSSSHDRFSFLRGKITFCSLTPLRSIPAQVIAIMGLDDGAFPRRDAELGFDMMVTHQLPGDRSGAREDRYLFLEALMSARRSFWCFYNGRSRRTGKNLESSPVLGELMDYLEQRFGITEIRHCLHSFDYRYFSGDDRFFSWSKDNFNAAKILAARQKNTEKSRVMVLENIERENIERYSLDELIRWARHPAEYVFERNLQVNFVSPENVSPGEMITAVNALQRYKIESAFVNLEKNGLCGEDSYFAMKNNNMLPPGEAGKRAFAAELKLLRSIDPFWRNNYFSQEQLAMSFDVELPEAKCKINVPGLYNCSPQLDSQHILVFAGFKHKYFVDALMRHHGLCMISDASEIYTTIVYRSRGKWEKILWKSKGKNELSRLFWQAFMNVWLEFSDAVPALFPQTLFCMFSAKNQEDILSAGADAFAEEQFDDPVINRCFSPDALNDPGVVEELQRFFNLFYRDFLPGGKYDS